MNHAEIIKKIGPCKTCGGQEWIETGYVPGEPQHMPCPNCSNLDNPKVIEAWVMEICHYLILFYMTLRGKIGKPFDIGFYFAKAYLTLARGCALRGIEPDVHKRDWKPAKVLVREVIAWIAGFTQNPAALPLWAGDALLAIESLATQAGINLEQAVMKEIDE